MKTMKKRYQQQMFFTAALIAAVIFIAGMFLGFVLDRYRVNDVLSSLRQNELNTESYFLEQQIIEKLNASSCEIARPRAQVLSEELGKVGRELTTYKADSIFKGEDYDYLLRRYFLLEIRTHIFFREMNKKCENTTHIILFFYKVDDDSSIKQGYALDEVVRQNKGVSVFSFDIDYGADPIMKTFRSQYNATSAPTIIINDNHKIEGYASVGEIMALLNGESQ